MRLVSAIVLAGLVFAASASAATEKRTNACFRAHRIAVKVVPRSTVTRFGVRVLAIEAFSFHGAPAKAYDNGTLLFERSAKTAIQAQHTLYSRLAAYEIKHGNGTVSPSQIHLNLKNTQAVVRNVVVFWNNYPQHLAAKRILAGCLR